MTPNTPTPRNKTARYHDFRFCHSHGGTGCGSAYKPFLASRPSLSNPSRAVSPGADFLNHHHQPSLTRV